MNINQTKNALFRRSRRLLTAISLGLCLPAAGMANAAPSLFPLQNNQLHHVVNEIGAVVLGDSSDPNTLWVIPPTTGVAQLSNYSFSGNIGFCDSLLEIQDSDEYYNRLRKLPEHLVIEAYERLLAIEEEIEGVKAQLDGCYDESDIQELEDLIASLEGNLIRLSQRRSTCHDVECDNLDESIAETQAELDFAKGKKSEVQEEFYERYSACRSLARQLARLERKADDILSAIERYQRAIDKLLATIRAGYERYAEIQGGQAILEFNSTWEESVNQIRDANPLFNVQPIPTSNVELQFTSALETDQPQSGASYGPVLGSSIAGISGEEGSGYLPALPDSLSGNVQLSLTGACPLANPQDYGLEREDVLAQAVGLSATYEYPTVFHTEVSVTYNLFRLYESYRQYSAIDSGKGLFSRLIPVTGLDDLTEQSEISFTFNDEQGLTRSERLEIQREVVDGLLQEVLALVADPVLDSNDSIFNGGFGTALPSSHRPGARSRSCQVSLFCRGVGWQIREAAGTPAFADFESTLKATLDRSETRTYSRSDLHYRPGFVGFKPQGRF